MLETRITTDLHTPDVARVFRLIRITEGLSMRDAGKKVGLSGNAVRGREARGINNIDAINEYLLALGYKATIVIQKIRSNH